MEKFNEGICMAVDYSILESWNIDTSRLLVSIYVLSYESPWIIGKETFDFSCFPPPPSPSWGEILFEMNYSRNKG